MKSRNFAYKAAMVLSMVAAIGFTACGDDSSNSTPAAPTIETPASSATVADPNQNPAQTPSENPVENPGQVQDPTQNPIQNPEENQATQDPASSSTSTEATAGCAAGDTPAPATFSQDVFNDIGDVYKNIQCNEKVIFLVRHGERENFTGSASALTEDGFEAAIKAGQKMPGTEHFKYIYSGMERTKQTAMGFAAGRGEITYTTTYAEGSDELEHFTVISPEFVADTMAVLRDGWFLKDKDARDANMKQDSITNVNVLYAAWAYDGKYADVFYELDARSQELIGMIVSDYAAMPKYTLVASHDQVLMPLTVWATERKIDLRLHNPDMPRNWLNYLAGLAIIVNDKNEIRYAPIKGINDVVMPNGTIIDGGVQ